MVHVSAGRVHVYVWACVCGYMPVTEACAAPLPWPGRCLTAPQGSSDSVSRRGLRVPQLPSPQHAQSPQHQGLSRVSAVGGASCRGPGKH